jgi:hypothetical protein
MSDLFLDTEVRWSIGYVARVVVESGYDDEEVERIWKFEVTPEFSANLWAVAGEWALFDIDEARLLQRAVRAASSRPGRWREWRYRAAIGSSHALWVAVKTLAAVLRASPPESRDPRVAAWRSFSHAFFEERLSDIMFVESEIDQLRQVAAGGHPIERFLDEALPAFGEVLIGDERRSRVERIENAREIARRARQPR